METNQGSCPVCESTAIIYTSGELTEVHCQRCEQYIFVAGVTDELAGDPEWPKLRMNLSRALGFCFRKSSSPVVLQTALFSASASTEL
jgi:hypothetical protein